jgi:hypothetical protein
MSLSDSAHQSELPRMSDRHGTLEVEIVARINGKTCLVRSVSCPIRRNDFLTAPGNANFTTRLAGCLDDAIVALGENARYLADPATVRKRLLAELLSDYDPRAKDVVDFVTALARSMPDLLDEEVTEDRVPTDRLELS